MRAILRILPRRIPFTQIRTFNMSSTAYSSTPSEQPSSSPPKEPLALPEISSNSTQLDMSNGDTSVKLDHLGPMVVNVDGTLSRIANWEAMAEIEKNATIRIIGKRNRERLEVLKTEAKAEEETTGSAGEQG